VSSGTPDPTTGGVAGSRRFTPHERLVGTAESDARPFADLGIPTGGLTTGGDGIKTWRQQALYGGKAGKPYNPCHRKACDDLANVDHRVLRVNATALTHVVHALAQQPPA
jgi:hypothetical protein